MSDEAVIATPCVKEDGTLVAYLHRGDVIRTLVAPDMPTLMRRAVSCGISEYGMDQEQAESLSVLVEDTFSDHQSTKDAVSKLPEAIADRDKAVDHAKLLQDELTDTQAERDRLKAEAVDAESKLKQAQDELERIRADAVAVNRAPPAESAPMAAVNPEVVQKIVPSAPSSQTEAPSPAAS